MNYQMQIDSTQIPSSGTVVTASSSPSTCADSHLSDVSKAACFVPSTQDCHLVDFTSVAYPAEPQESDPAVCYHSVTHKIGVVEYGHGSIYLGADGQEKIVNLNHVLAPFDSMKLY